MIIIFIGRIIKRMDKFSSLENIVRIAVAQTDDFDPFRKTMDEFHSSFFCVFLSVENCLIELSTTWFSAAT